MKGTGAHLPLMSVGHAAMLTHNEKERVTIQRPLLMVFVVHLPIC